MLDYAASFGTDWSADRLRGRREQRFPADQAAARVEEMATFLADGGYFVSQGILALMTAISVAIALASGVILGEYVAQPLKREARKLESRLAGPRLVGPFRAMTRAERRALRKQSDG